MKNILFEKYLIQYCAPTLASLKTANLFACHGLKEQELFKCVKFWNECFAKKGVSICILHRNQRFSLIYVYRKNFLERDLRKSGVFRVLQYYGYTNTQIQYAIERLSERLSDMEDFPHEIGLFLGYPLIDVIGFIKNNGYNYRYVGCWKVYGNKRGAIRTFTRFDQCSSSYFQMWKEGRELEELVVEI